MTGLFQTKKTLLLLPTLMWLVTSLFVAQPRTVVVVPLLLAMFCLPGIPLVLRTGMQHRVNPAVILSAVCLSGYFVSTIMAVYILFVFPNAFAAALICPVILCAILSVLKGKKSDTSDDKQINLANGNCSLTLHGHRFEKRDMAAVLLIMALALSVSLPPLANVGKEYPEGRFYRAYFHTDYLKHVAVTAHLSHAEIPPDNPYLNTGEPLRYYWFFYLFPASVRALNISHVETMDILRIITIWGILVFCLLLYGMCRHITSRRTAAFLAVFGGLFAHSYEGLYLYRLIRQGNEPFLEALGRYNVDGTTRWFIGHPQIDALYRTLIFTPQHLFALMLFCLSFFIMSEWYSSNIRLSWTKIWSIGLMTGLIFGFSSFIGLIGYLWLTGLACLALIVRKDIRFTVHTGLSLAVTCLVLMSLGILYRRPDSLIFLPQSDVIKQFPQFLFYNYGPLILLFPLGLIRGLRTKRFLTFNLVPLLLACMFLILYVQIQNFPTDMGIKLGLVVSIVLIYFAAIGLSSQNNIFRRLFYSLAVLIMLPAATTLLMDVYNSSDVSNPLHSLFVEAEDIAAAEWIRDNLPKNIRIQTDPYQRYEAFSLIPVFAERRTVAGDRMHARIFLSDPEVFVDLEEAVDDIYRETDPKLLAQRMRRLDIDYMLVGRTERKLYPGTEKVFENFVTPYRKNRVSIHSARLAAELGEPTVSGQHLSDAYMYNLTIPVMSADPDRAHHYMVTYGLKDVDKTQIMEPESIMTHVSAGETKEITVSVSSSSPAAWTGIKLYHVSDQNDAFFCQTFCLVTKHRRFHTTGIVVEGQNKPYVSAVYPEQPTGIITRFSAGVLPAGQYEVFASFPIHDDWQGDISGGVLRAYSTHKTWQTELVPNEGKPLQSNRLRFEMNDISDIIFDIEIHQDDSVAVDTLHLEWICSEPYPYPVSERDIAVAPLQP
jgi:hypothetical protein